MSLPPDINERLLGRTWYHLRFDGSPMFLYAIAEAELRQEARKPAGTEADIRVAFYENGAGDWYLDKADIERGTRAIIALAKTDPEISKKLLAAWREDEAAFADFFREFFRIDLARLETTELTSLWERFRETGVRRFTSSSVIDHFALGTDELIGEMLRRELGVTERESDFTEVFSVATAPVHQSFINLAEIDLLKIAAGDSSESLADYQRRYYWTKNNYITAQVLSVEHFEEEIAAWRASGRDLQAEWRRIEQTPHLNQQKKAALFAKNHFSPLLHTLLKISEDFTWWQDERKKATYWNIDMGSRLMAEVARRTGFALELLKYAYAPEIPQILANGGPSIADLQARRQGSVFVYTREHVGIATGAEMEKIRNVMLGNRRLDEIQDVRGLTASVGRAIGPVKIIRSVAEIGKVETGDVLVAVMTRPDYLPAMKKAAAIVTDEGGITSHAAIVSRELEVPCIIGTKIATSVFHDGEQVEVNANHGWARKLAVSTG